MKNVVPPGDANDNGGLVVPNNTPFSNPPSEDGDVDFEDEHKYPSDSYSFLALHGPRDDLVFFSFGVMAFLFQFTFLLLTSSQKINDRDNLERSSTTPETPGLANRDGFPNSSLPTPPK
jgi:hypothetical protein